MGDPIVKESQKIAKAFWLPAAPSVTFSRVEYSLLTSDRPVISNVFPLPANHVCLPIGLERMFFACATEGAQRQMQRMDPREIMRVMNDEVTKRALGSSTTG